MMYSRALGLWIVLTFGVSQYLIAQSLPDNPNLSDAKGRQGKWTILLDDAFAATKDTTKATFYRIVNFQNDKPLGPVRDYRKSGILYREAEMLADRPEEILHGNVSYYDDQGLMEAFYVYEQGNIRLDQTESTLLEMWNQSPRQWDLLFTVGMFYMETLGHKANAVLYLEKYIEALKEAHLEGTVRYAKGLYYLGWSYLRYQDFINAQPVFLKMLAIQEKQEDPALYVGALATVGDMFRYMGRAEEAISYLNKAMMLYTEKGVEDIEIKMTIYNNLSLCYELKGEEQQAIDLIQQAMQEYADAKSVMDPTLMSIFYANLGYYYQRLNLLDSAEQYLMKSLVLTEEVYGRNHSEFLLFLSQIGDLHYRKGELDKAAQTYKEAYEGHARISSENNEMVINEKRNYALMLYALGEKEQAYTILRQTGLMRQDYIESYFDYLSEPERLAFYRTYSGYINEQISWMIAENDMHPELRSDLMNMRLRNKALLYNTSNTIKKRILKSGDRKLIALYDQVQQMRQQLGMMATLTNDEAFRQYGLDKDSLQLAYEQMDRDLNALSGLYKTSNRPVQWQDARATLQKGEALVEIIRYEVSDFHNRQFMDSIQYIGLLITAKTKDHPKLFFLNDGKVLEGKGIRQYQNSIRFKREDQESYDLFWKPIRQELKGIRKVFLSLDGVYHKISIGSLYNPQKKTFVMDEIEINLVTSGRDLMEQKTEKLPVKSGLLIGNPSFGEFKRAIPEPNDYYKLLLASNRRSGFADLPGAAIEVQKVQQILRDNGWREVTLLDEEADERKLKEMLKPNVLHFATHGFFEDESYGIQKHPMYRSGLLLSGAAETLKKGTLGSDRLEGREDGILTAFEAMNLNIDNTSLVVLSACETGLGEVVNGEGVYGLQRAFKIAGARTIIMSLWKVDDMATQELMVAFYENWMEHNMTKRQALQQARLDIRKKYPHPFYWGAFVILGE